MRLVTCIVLLSLGGLARANDLATIERELKTPARFSTKHQHYGLVVLGPEKAHRVWFVIDGDDLYVDRNGNGDLTEAGERIAIHKTRPRPTGFLSKQIEWRLSGFAFSKRYTDIRVRLHPINVDWRPPRDARNRKRMLAFMDAVRHVPAAHFANIYVRIDGKRTQFSNTLLGRSPDTAPVLHMDGPVTAGLVDSFYPFQFWLGERLAKFTVAMGTPGFGRASFSYLTYDELSETARPVVEIQFPAKRAGAFLPKQRYELTDRCCHYQFFDPLTLPKEAGPGKAKVKISFPGLKALRVQPREIEIDVVPIPESAR